MAETKQPADATRREDSPEGGPGDVESAGETTAAAAPADAHAHDKPVGADTMVKVEETAATNSAESES